MAIWDIKERKHTDLIDQLLLNRAVGLTEEKEKFLNPNFENDLHDPFLMTGVKEAVERIARAKKNREVIGIFSDYDADGIPGAALMYKAFSAIGLESIVYIPNRQSGYGLSKEGINFLISKKCSLIITIDLGIKNFNEAAYCREKGIDLIITDHHLPDDDLPKADLVINPKIKGDNYPFKELCGCGVAFKLIQALGKEFPTKIDQKFLKWNLDLVAISTISDVVPLIGENRVLAKYGLVVLRKTKNIGLAELHKVCGIVQEKINSYVVGFQIGPRVNAPGRIDCATKSFELLVTEDREEANCLALWLNEKNEERQRQMDQVEREAMADIEKNGDSSNKLIIVSGEWPKGVIGPTASRLVEKLNKPVMIFSYDNKESYTGSARSIEGVNILELIKEFGDLVQKFGGHKGAAGLTLIKSKFAKFSKQIISSANSKINALILTKKVRVDAEMCPDEVKFETIRLIEKMEPFGMGNPRPCFYLSDSTVSQIRLMGKDNNHLSFNLNKDALSARCVYFNFKEKIEAGIYDIVFGLENNHWNGKDYLKINIVDMRKNAKD